MIMGRGRGTGRGFRRRLVPYLYLLAPSLVIGCERAPRGAAPGSTPPADAPLVFVTPSPAEPLAAAIVGGAAKVIRDTPIAAYQTVQPDDPTAEALRRAVSRALDAQPAVLAVWFPCDGSADAAADVLQASTVLLVTAGALPATLTPRAHVSIEWVEGAEMLGRSLPRLAPGKRSYLLLHEDGRDAWRSQVYGRFAAEARLHFNLTLLEARAALRGDGRALLGELVARYPHAGLLVSLTDSPWGESGGRFETPGNSPLAVLSAAPAMWPRLRSGEAVGLVGPVAGDVGRQVGALMLGALVGDVPPGTVRHVPCELVTRESLDSFEMRYQIAGNLPPPPPPVAPPRRP